MALYEKKFHICRERSSKFVSEQVSGAKEFKGLHRPA